LQRRLQETDQELRAWSAEASTAPVKARLPYVRAKAECVRHVAYWEDQRVALELRMRDLLDDPEAAP